MRKVLAVLAISPIPICISFAFIGSEEFRKVVIGLIGGAVVLYLLVWGISELIGD